MSAARSAPEIQDPEIPDPNRIGDFPIPRETSDFFGNRDAEQELLDALRSRRMHHAWLLTGPRGIGKATLAYRFARFLLSHRANSDFDDAADLSMPADQPVFRQIANLAHPDLLVLQRPWQHKVKRHASVITVDEVRRLRPFLGQTAAGAAWRVVIIDAADELNIAAVNALLKALEEPPEACVFLLVCSQPGRLPITVRSRCRSLRLAPLGEDALQQAVTAACKTGAQEPPSGIMSNTLVLSQGSPGTALRLLAEEGADLYRQLLELIGNLPDPDYVRVHKLADTLTAAGAESRYDLFFSMLSGLVSRLVRQAATGAGAIGDEVQIASRIAGPHGLARWAGLWETLQRAKAEADALNLDRKLLVLETVFRLERAARRN